MEFSLLLSLLLVPVVLLASPITLLTLKGRPDIARLYLICMLLAQVALLIAHWDNLQRAASWVLLLLGLSLIIGCGLTWYKTRLTQWLKYTLSLVVFNSLLLTLAVPSSALFD